MKHSLHPSEIASLCLAVGMLLLALWLHLLPALLAGLLVYELVHVLAPLLRRRLSDERSRLVAVVILASLIVGAVTAAVVGAVAFFRSDSGSLPMLLQKMADIIDGARYALPEWINEALPGDADALREALAHWLRTHAQELRLAGTEAGRAFAHILIGMVIGAIISLRETAPARAQFPLAHALSERTARLGLAFRCVVFAQVRIAALNALFTGIYLALVLPALGIHLPLTKTLIAVTFLFGLLPIVGNLLSNAAIVIVSLAASPQIALASLVYLVVIHKLEYFFNAKIIGSRIDAHAWELLLAMVAMEAAFGLPGVVAAPIYYAYVKYELKARGLV
ncbi:MAG TPA: AI-2E family transporter [Burkholderiales bacterium]|nr:AI-2E family transporter [Burkholderiales bacterium]